MTMKPFKTSTVVKTFTRRIIRNADEDAKRVKVKLAAKHKATTDNAEALRAKLITQTSKQVKIDTLKVGDKFMHAGQAHEAVSLTGPFPLFNVTTANDSKLRFKSGQFVLLLTR